MLWYVLGLVYLLILTYQDIFKKRMVNERYNWFMMGLSAGLIPLFSHVWWYLLALIGISIGLGVYIGVYLKRSYGQVDAQSITWVFYGFALIGFDKLITFTVTFISTLIIYQIIRRIGWKNEKKAPFYPVILLSFIINGLIIHNLFI